MTAGVFSGPGLFTYFSNSRTLAGGHAGSPPPSGPARGRLRALRVPHRKSVLYGAFVYGRAGRAAAETGGFRPGQNANRSSGGGRGGARRRPGAGLAAVPSGFAREGSVGRAEDGRPRGAGVAAIASGRDRGAHHGVNPRAQPRSFLRASVSFGASLPRDRCDLGASLRPMSVPC
jgi:hypothetical protein